MAVGLPRAGPGPPTKGTGMFTGRGAVTPVTATAMGWGGTAAPKSTARAGLRALGAVVAPAPGRAPCLLAAMARGPGKEPTTSSPSPS